MNKTLLITVSVAALVAAGGVAFAQGVSEPRDKAAVAAPVPIRKLRRVKREDLGGVKPGIGHDTGSKVD